MTKRVAMLTDNADPLAPLGGHEAGGENVYVLEMSRALARLGWTVDIFTRWNYPKTAQFAKVSDNVNVIRLEAGPVTFIPKEELFPYMQTYVERFLEYREKTKAEYLLLHGNYYLSGWAGVQIARILHIPMVNTFHTLGIVKHNALGQDDPSPDDRIAREQYVMDEIDRCIATSPQMRDELIQYYHVNPKKIVVLAEGANLKRFMSVPQLLARRALRFGPVDMIILYIGRIERRKGLDTLIEAADLIVREMPDKRSLLKVHISGGEPRKAWKKQMSPEKNERQRLQGIVDRLKLGDVVKFIGGIDREDLPLHYSAADVTVVPSYYEPFGLVPLESMACGTPVIASKVGGLQYTVKDGKTGYLVPPRDAAAFASKIVHFLKHPTVGKQMRENGMERVKRYFSWDIVAQDMSSFYTDFLLEYFYRKSMQKTNGKNGLV